MNPADVTISAHSASRIQRLEELLPVLLSRTDQIAVAVDNFGTVVGDTLVEAGYRFTVVEATSRAPTRIRVEALPF